MGWGVPVLLRKHQQYLLGTRARKEGVSWALFDEHITAGRLNKPNQLAAGPGRDANGHISCLAANTGLPSLELHQIIPERLIYSKLKRGSHRCDVIHPLTRSLGTLSTLSHVYVYVETTADQSE